MSVRPAARERTSSCDSTSSDCMPNICGVCWNKYNEGRRIPKSLVCGHTICHTCVNGLISHTAKITCPLCRKETRTRLGDIPTNYQLLQLLQKMGLLCKDPESRPASPGQNHEDLLAIEDELRGSFTGALSHFSSIVDEVTKSINDLGLDPLKVMPHSRNFRTAASFGGEPPTVLDAAQKRLAALGQVYTELEKDIEAARNRQKKIEECLRNGSVSVDQNMKKLKFLRSDVAAELGPFPDHMPSRTMPYQLRTTPPPFMIDPVVDSGFGTIQFFDDIDVLRWEEQEAVFGDVSPNEEDDDEDFDDDTIYGYGWGGSAGPNSEDGYEANFSDDIDEAITNCFCYLCNCQLPHDNASRRTHVSGRRHRETKAANEPFVISFKAEAETHLSYHTHLRDFIPNLNLRIEVPDTRPFRQGRSGRGGRGGGNRAPQQRQDVHHGGPGPSGGNHRRGRGRGGGGGNRNGQRRPGYRVPQENQDVPGHVIPNFSWQPYNDWHGAEQPGFGW